MFVTAINGWQLPPGFKAMLDDVTDSYLVTDDEERLGFVVTQVALHRADWRELLDMSLLALKQTLQQKVH